MNLWKKILLLLPFWVYALFFKFGAALHFSLLSWLGSQVMPIWIVGILIGVGSFVQMILDVPTGYLLDRFGYVKIMQVGAFLFIIGGLVLLFGLSINTFYLTLLFSTFGWLTFGPGSNAYVLSSAPRGQGGRFMGLYHMVASAGVVLSAIGVIIALQVSIPHIAIFISSVIMVAFVALFFVVRPKYSVHQEKNSVHHHYYIRRHFFHRLLLKINALRPAFSILSIQYFVGSIFYASIWFVLPLILASQVHNSALGLGLSVFDLSIVLLGSYLGKLADRLNNKKLVFCGLLVFALMSAASGFNLTIWFLVFGFLSTACDELSEVSLWSWINRLERNHDQDGSLSGIVILFGDLGYAVGPIFAGILYETMGPEWTIAICAAPIGILWICYSYMNLPRRQALATPIGSEMPERVFRFRHKH